MAELLLFQGNVDKMMKFIELLFPFLAVTVEIRCLLTFFIQKRLESMHKLTMVIIVDEDDLNEPISHLTYQIFQLLLPQQIVTQQHQSLILLIFILLLKYLQSLLHVFKNNLPTAGAKLLLIGLYD